MQEVKNFRKIIQVVPAVKKKEGAGVTVYRTMGTSNLPNLDPYLMLDEMKCPAQQAIVGFPDHPHRGFETCSIMLVGDMEHRDSAGNQGVIGPGGVQWMTAGRGIVHSEMPKADQGLLWGFQLWINLPKKDKMVKPRYQDYQADKIPVYNGDGYKIRVIAGEGQTCTGPINMRNPGMLLDVLMDQDAHYKEAIPVDWTAYVYVYDGSGSICGESCKSQTGYVFNNGGQGIEAKTGNGEAMRFLLIAGKPIGERIVQYGPFVMNTEDEIQQAFADYQSGRLQNPDDNPWIDQ